MDARKRSDHKSWRGDLAIGRDREIEPTDLHRGARPLRVQCREEDLYRPALDRAARWHGVFRCGVPAGAPGGIRTPDPLLRRQPLCPLSYGRIPPALFYHILTPSPKRKGRENSFPFDGAPHGRCFGWLRSSPCEDRLQGISEVRLPDLCRIFIVVVRGAVVAEDPVLVE